MTLSFAMNQNLWFPSDIILCANLRYLREKIPFCKANKHRWDISYTYENKKRAEANIAPALHITIIEYELTNFYLTLNFLFNFFNLRQLYCQDAICDLCTDAFFVDIVWKRICLLIVRV